MPTPAYTVRISDKAKRYHLEIDWHKGLVVVVPKRWNEQTVNRLIFEKQDWILKHLKNITKEKTVDSSDIIQNEHLKEKDIRSLFNKEVTFWAKAMNVSFERIFLRNQKSKWGSCSRDGNLNFNWHLAHSPAGVREYVIIHELAHLRHPNHSGTFWKEVEKYCPDYKIPRKWLRVNGRILTHSINSVRD